MPGKMLVDLSKVFQQSINRYRVDFLFYYLASLPPQRLLETPISSEGISFCRNNFDIS
jgi:hypothetical protein